jgi:hypothetical protein
VKLSLFIAAAAIAAAQSSTSTYQTDINGRRVELRSSDSTNGTRTERMQSINGRDVPLEQSDEKVLREDSSGKVVERIIRKYDATGRLTTTERVVSEQQNLPSGGSSVKQTTYRSDINGSMREAERRTTVTQVSGGNSTAETTVQRPSINGNFETAERRTSTTETGANTSQTSETVYRLGPSGQMSEALREIKVVTKKGDATTETSSVYEPNGANSGRLDLASQSVSTSFKRPDGTDVTEVSLYSRAAPGQAQTSSEPQQIKEQQLTERTTRPDGSVVETLSVRRPSLADPNRLGSLQKISETVCKGKCDAKP